MWSLERRRKECIELPDIPLRIEVSEINQDSVLFQIDGPLQLKVLSAETGRPGYGGRSEHGVANQLTCLPANMLHRLRVVDSSLRLFVRQVEQGFCSDAEDTLQQAIWELRALDREFVSDNAGRGMVAST